MRSTALFSVTAAGTATLGFQWQSNGVNLVNGNGIAGATSSTLLVSNVSLDSTGQFRVVITNCVGTLTSAAATLSVVPVSAFSLDFNSPGQFTNAPYNMVGNDWIQGGGTTLVNNQPFGPIIPFEVSTGGVGVATGGGGLDLMFNVGNDVTYTFLPLKYDFTASGAALSASIMVKIKFPVANNRAMQIGFVNVTNGHPAVGNNVIAGVNSVANTEFMTAILQSTAQPAPTYQLQFQHKVFAGTANVNPTPADASNTAASLLTNNWYKFVAKFVNTRDVGNASSNFTVQASLQDMGATGLTPGSTVLSYAPQTAVNFDLVNSTNLFFCFRSFENCGMDYYDNIYVTTQPGTVKLVTPLPDQTVAQGRTASYRAMVDGDGPYLYQWFKNGVQIPNESNWKLTTAPFLASENGAKISVTVTGPSSSISSTSTVTVVVDPLKILSVGSVDGGSIGVRFNQPVDKTSAQNPANYSVNGTPAIAAQLLSGNSVQQYRTNGTELLLVPASPVSGSFTVTASGVSSVSGDVISSPNDTATGVAAGLSPIDIDPQSIGMNLAISTIPGYSYSFAPGQFTIIAAGHDIFGAFDGFRFTYKQITGDFDIKVRVPYQDVIRTPNKAGFDVRVSLDPAAPNVGAFVDPMLPGRNFFEAGVRPTYNAPTTSWGATPVAFYPNCWLRLRRVGNTFMYYNSTNGVNWAHQGQTSPVPAFPPTLYFGLAANCNVGVNTLQQLNTAQFDNYGDFAGYPGATIAISSGPSNITVAAGSAATFTNLATVTGGGIPAAAGELTYLWQRTNTAVGGWTNMPTAGATNNILNTGALFFSDTGARYPCHRLCPGRCQRHEQCCHTHGHRHRRGHRRLLQRCAAQPESNRHQLLRIHGRRLRPNGRKLPGHQRLRCESEC